MPTEYRSNDRDNGPAAAQRLAQEWADRVTGNREQAERLREFSDGGDHYQPIAASFRADPRRTGDTVLDALLAIADADDIWLDVGAGAGRFALPLALHVSRVIAVEPSPGMREELSAALLEHGITNLEVRDQRWPSDDPALTNIADTALISHVAYDIEHIGAFLDTLDRAARRECIAVLFDRSPSSLFSELWPAIHGEEQVQLPGGNEFAALLEARGALVAQQEIGANADRPRFRFETLDDAMEWARRRLWLAEDSPRLPVMRDAVTDLLVEHDDGWSLPNPPTQMLIRWRTP